MSDESELQERVRREQEAHTVDDVLAESYRLKDRFPHIYSYPSRLRLLSTIDHVVDSMQGKSVLDYGCGRGDSSLKYLANGATVYGIDISPTYIEEARQKAEDAGFSEARYKFAVMDAHALDFGDNTFDLVIGNGILHHLHAERALDEIHRVLKPGGRVLLEEPLADNPLLRIFRALTPKARTEDEAPFSGEDISRLIRTDRWQSETTFCGVIEAPVAMITSVLRRKHPDNTALRLADRLERWMLGKDLLLSWNQYLLFNLVKQ